MDGDVKAIPLSGIVHNETKIGVQDGMCEDLVNLRFKDGSWRTSGDGEFMATLSHDYDLLFVHTNVYRHLLGVRDGGLYWIGDIDPDGEVTLDESRDPITSVGDDVKLTQNGHLLTVIDDKDNFEHFVFKTSTNQYIKVVVDENGAQTDRTLYPFGQVHFNWYSARDEEHVLGIPVFIVDGGDRYYLPKDNVVAALGKLEEENRLTQPILAVSAIELYDGSFVYAGNPVLINPCERASFLENNEAFSNVADNTEEDETYDTGYKVDFDTFRNAFPNQTSPTEWVNKTEAEEDGMYSPQNSNGFLHPVYAPNAAVIAPNNFGATPGDASQQVDIVTRQTDAQTPGGKTIVSTNNLDKLHPCESYPAVYGYISTIYHNGLSTNRSGAFVRGYDLVMSIADKGILEANTSVFKSICVFITTQASLYDLQKDDYERDFRRMSFSWSHHPTSSAAANEYSVISYTYAPKTRSVEEITYELLHSPFFLLKRYDVKNLNEIIENPVIDLQRVEDKGIVKAIATQSDILTSESISRVTYLPKVVYNYNGRLHIADYKSRQFHGYPLDQFQKNNHSVKYQAGGEYLGLTNLADNNDGLVQWGTGATPVNPYGDLISKNAPIMIAVAEIETSDGMQVVSRYIPATRASEPREMLGAMLSFPDYRAKKLTIYSLVYNQYTQTGYAFSKKEFELRPHPYLNMAYYLSPDLKPISWTSGGAAVVFTDTDAIFALVEELNAEEYFPNGLKVSKTDSPMFFPVENTYQVGSAQILALCSNTIAVGTGQTGDAPLYVFCKDGIYALFVDASGLMAYPNARAIARDVLNNARSVTPIDAGVAFTTDRGLMLIAGEQVKEIGQPLEGDYRHFADPGSVDSTPVAKNAFTHNLLAALSANALTQTDFLTYLKGSIINYNHNEWELMVSNPSYNYTYVLDKQGSWSRRDYGADLYVNNYPTSYRVRNGEMYQVDTESDDDNGMFMMSREIKLDSIGFKSLQRVVARGFFATKEPLYYEESSEEQATSTEGEEPMPDEIYYLGLYVFGSYDSRKWACLGHREKTGTFTDIGCLVERTDCRFFRIVLAGQLQKESRLDYIEVSSKPSVLNTKIR